MANEFPISNETRTQIDGVISAVISGLLGIELVETRYFKQYGTPTLEVLIWKKEGVTLSDCETVHEAVSNELDKYDELFPATYNLNISSQGLDRKIVTDDDYRRAEGTEIECITAEKKKVRGTLVAYDNETVTVEIGGAKKTLKRNNLTKVQPYIRF